MREQNHFLLLDGMRGVAALAVIWFHLHFVVGYDCAGPLAVDLFFVLSGFVVAAAYDDRLDHDLSIIAFLRKRFVRLYPMFFTGLLFALVVQQVLILRHAGRLSERETVLSFLLEALWLPSPFSGGTGWTFPLDGPAWSLSLEVLINLLFAVSHRRLNDLILVSIVAISGAAVVTAIFLSGTINQGWSWATLPFGLARVGYAFPLGVLMYRHRHGIPAWVSRCPAWLPLGVLAAILLLPERASVDIAFLLVSAPLLIAIGFRASPGRGSSLLRLLGYISYPLYAIHGPIVLLVQGATKVLQLHAIGPLVGVLALASMVGASIGLGRWEKVARGRLSSMLARRHGKRRPTELAT